jgi:SAM-dependent methyltransferase
VADEELDSGAERDVKRVVQAIVAAVFVALVALALFVVRPAPEAENRVELGPGIAGAFRDEATLRNVTTRPIEYTILPGPGRGSPRKRTLAVGSVDRLATDVPVEISFDSGRRTTVYAVHPGKPYSFRFDENDLLRLYPGSHGLEDAADLAPYVPTPPEVVDRMIELAAIGPEDVVYDLGCGDGRMVIAAAKSRGARGVGIELDAALLEECRASAAREGVSKLVKFVRLDATKADLTKATVVLLYLLPESLGTLAPLFDRDLGPGARIVSHDYRIPGWDERLVLTEVLPGEGVRDHKILLYRMPER